MTCTLTHEANDLHLLIVECDFCPETWSYNCQDLDAQRTAQADWIEHLREHQNSLGKLSDLNLEFTSKAPKASARDQRHWRNGYQEALYDITQKLLLGGAEEAAEWILNNKSQDWG